jgi:hypothetical protein
MDHERKSTNFENLVENNGRRLDSNEKCYEDIVVYRLGRDLLFVLNELLYKLITLLFGASSLYNTTII